MYFLTFIAALVLLFAGQDWFSGAETVGWILLAVTVALFVLQVLVFGLFAKATTKQHQKFFDNMP